jgi:hypothetical protein
VLGSVGGGADVDVLTQALADPEPLVSQSDAWTLERIAEHQQA